MYVTEKDKAFPEFPAKLFEKDDKGKNIPNDKIKLSDADTEKCPKCGSLDFIWDIEKNRMTCTRCNYNGHADEFKSPAGTDRSDFITK